MALSASEAAPIIGVTTYLEQAQTGVWDVEASFLPKVYIDAVTAAGGIALLLPPQPCSPAVAAAVVARLDGLIVSGGADVEPARYGREPHPATGAPRRERDEWELALLQAAGKAKVPYLGICRGAQVLNVLRGGTLHQHLPDLVGSTRYQPGAASFGTESVAVELGSALGGLLGPDVEAKVYHHQAIDVVGAGLRVTARSADGVIEAIEDPDAGFGLAVQWHPEEDAHDRRVFVGLMEAAAQYAQQKRES